MDRTFFSPGSVAAVVGGWEPHRLHPQAGGRGCARLAAGSQAQSLEHLCSRYGRRGGSVVVEIGGYAARVLSIDGRGRESSLGGGEYDRVLVLSGRMAPSVFDGCRFRRRRKRRFR